MVWFLLLDWALPGVRRRLTHLPLDLSACADLRHHVDQEMYDADVQEDGNHEPPRFCQEVSLIGYGALWAV